MELKRRYKELEEDNDKISRISRIAATLQEDYTVRREGGREEGGREEGGRREGGRREGREGGRGREGGIQGGRKEGGWCLFSACHSPSRTQGKGSGGKTLG